MRKKIIVVCADFGVGGISKSAVEWLNLVDYEKYEITLYIRRKDVLEMLPFLTSDVKIVTVENDVKKQIYGNDLKGKIIKFLCKTLKKFKANYLAKQLFRWYKFPIQRKKEKEFLEKNGMKFDVAIAYSTSDDIPTFVLNDVTAPKKYLFIHQSTSFSKENQKVLPKFDAVIAVSEYLCEKLKNQFGNRKIKFLNLSNYVNRDSIIDMSEEDKPIKEIKSEAVRIATCGRLVPVKGYDILLDTADILKENNVNFSWSWIGDGQSRSQMEKGIREKKLDDYIVLEGEKINPYPYIADCDLYVQPSVAEAFPLTILEALALGKPVISTPTVGAKSIFKKLNCGIMAGFEPKDIADIIIELYGNKELIEYEISRVNSIDWNRDKERYINQWDSLLSGREDDLLN